MASQTAKLHDEEVQECYAGTSEAGASESEQPKANLVRCFDVTKTRYRI